MPLALEPQRFLSRLVGLSAALWLCRQFSGFGRAFGLLGALVLRIVHRGRSSERAPEPGHLLQDAHYPGARPSEEATAKAKALLASSQEAEEPAEALRLLGQAVLLNPPDPALYYARAEAYWKQSLPVESLDNAELAASLSPGWCAAWYARGRAERALGRAADAALSFEAGLQVEPTNLELSAALEEVKAEPTPSPLRRLRAIISAARLGIEELYESAEDIERTTEVFVDSNRALLDSQLGILSQTLRVNTTTLHSSPMLSEAYQQIVYTCSQLVAAAPAAFARLDNAPKILEGLSLALRVGWHVHHAVPKMAANALVAMSTSANANDHLRRMAVRQLFGGMLRWLIDARPEPGFEEEEVCGCSCLVPWKASACFLERFFEPGVVHPWVLSELEAWPDIAQFCQWLTMAVRDYHATPLGLVGLLRIPGVAAAVMRSEAIVDFFRPLPPFELEIEGEDVGSGDVGASGEPQGDRSEAAAGLPRRAARAPAGAAAEGASTAANRPHSVIPETGRLVIHSAAPPPPERLGEWIMASIAYLLLFIDGDVLFTVSACRALQAMAAADARAGGEGVARLVRGLWLGVPLLSRLSVLACYQDAALDLLHDLLRSPYRGVRVAARSLANSLARAPPSQNRHVKQLAAALALEREDKKAPRKRSSSLSGSDGEGSPASPPATFQEELSRRLKRVVANKESARAGNETPPGTPTRVQRMMEMYGERPPGVFHGVAADDAVGDVAEESLVMAAAVAARAVVAANGPPGHHADAELLLREDLVPSWAEFYQELLNELAYYESFADAEPQLVSLAHFDHQARLWSQQGTASLSISSRRMGEAGARAEEENEAVFSSEVAGGSSASSSSTYGLRRSRRDVAAAGEVEDKPFVCAAVPASWSRLPSAGLDATPLLLCHQAEDDDIGSEQYVNDPKKKGRIVLMSRRSIRRSTKVHNWAQAVSAAQKAGAVAVVVYNNLDGAEPFCMGLFGEQAPTINAYMVSGADGFALGVAATLSNEVSIVRHSGVAAGSGASLATGLAEEDEEKVPQWPLDLGRMPMDVAQAWSLMEALSAHDPSVRGELQTLVGRMDVPEKRVWLTRSLMRYHRARQAAEDGGPAEDQPLAFVEGDRELDPRGQLAHVRRQLCEQTGLGAEDLCGDFEARFRGEHGVGSAVVREWMDLVARDAFLSASNGLLRSMDRRQTFWPHPAAPFCNPHWQMDYEAIGRLLGLALWQGGTLDLPLHPHVCGLLFGFQRAQLSTTLKQVDPELWRSKVDWLLTHSVEELGLDMPLTDTLRTDDCDAPGGAGKAAAAQEDKDSSRAAAGFSGLLAPMVAPVLTPFQRLEGDIRAWPGSAPLRVGSAEVLLLDAASAGGSDILTDSNKLAYTRALTEWRLYTSIEPQIAAMKRGLRTVVPDHLLQELRDLLGPVEISQLLSGLGDIDVLDWEKHTAYSHGLHPDDDVVKWFWRTVRGWADSGAEERTKLTQLLQFATGSTRVPVGGFSELVGFNGAKHPFTLAKADHLTKQSLPMVHACICTLDLPPYEDFETCKAKLSQMLSLGRARFDEAAGQAGSDD